MRRKNLTGAAVVALVIAGAVSAAEAGDITFTGLTVHDHGDGFGTVLNLLSVQKDTSEYGEVSWGLHGNKYRDIETGDAKANSDAPAVSAITALPGYAGNNLTLIFNINQQGNDASHKVTLHDFELTLWDDTGNYQDSIWYRAPTGGLDLQMIGHGTGQSGWLFRINNVPNPWLTNPTWHWGMRIGSRDAITNTDDGIENFFLATGANFVPLPPASLLGLGLLGGLGIVRLARRRRIAL